MLLNRGDRLFGWIRKLFAAPNEKGKIGNAPQLPDTKSKWIAAADNEFGIDVLDCAAFSKSMISSSDDIRIAATFAHLRGSLGAEYRDKTPANSKATLCDLTYPYDGKHADGALFKAPEMEFKWDIYIYDSKIYFTRSWTGDLIFVADVLFDTDRVRVRSITFGAERAGDAAYAVSCVDFLVKSHIFRCMVPHPLPKDYPNNPDQIAFFSFGQYGRFGTLASFGDTTRIKLPASATNEGSGA